jgi:hypothetical protein
MRAGHVIPGMFTGADPNKLVTTIDQPSATSPAPGESFHTAQTAARAQVLRGVSFTPGHRGRPPTHAGRR